MLSGAANVSRGLPAIGVLSLAGNQRLKAKSPVEIAGDEVVLTAVENPPRTNETRPIAALIPDVLARYGLNTASGSLTDVVPGVNQPLISSGTSIDVSV
jgi:hypothetical protein